MNKMNVVAFKSTNHVLGAATRSTQPDKALTVEEVAAHGIVLRGGVNAELQALIDKDHLTVALVDYDTRLVYRPHLFAVTDDMRVEQQDDAAGVSVALDGTKVTVTLPPPAPTGPVQAFVHVTGGALAEPAVRAVTIVPPATAGTAGLVLAAGNYTVVILAPGYTTRIVAEPVP